MKIAVNVIPSGGDTSWIMIIDMKKLKEDDPKQKEWIDAINSKLAGGHPEMTGGWSCLEKASVEKFPCKIHGVVDIFYEG